MSVTSSPKTKNGKVPEAYTFEVVKGAAFVPAALASREPDPAIVSLSGALAETSEPVVLAQEFGDVKDARRRARDFRWKVAAHPTREVGDPEARKVAAREAREAIEHGAVEEGGKFRPALRAR